MPNLTTWEKQQGISAEALVQWMETHSWSQSGYACTDFYNTGYIFSKGDKTVFLVVRTSDTFDQVLYEAIKTVASCEGMTLDELMSELRKIG